MKNIASLLAFLSFATTVSAAEVSLPVQTISSIQTGWGGEGIYLQLREGIRASGCNSGMYLIHKQNNPMYYELLSISLSAYHAKSKVILRVTNCSSPSDFSLSVVAINITE